MTDSDKKNQVTVSSAQAPALPQLLTKLDQEFEQLKNNPGVFLEWKSSDANTAIQFYLSNVNSANELTVARVQLLGKSGKFSAYLSELKQLPNEVRPQIAAQVNPVK